MTLMLSDLERRLLDAYEAEPDREFSTYDLCVIGERNRHAIYQARNRLWRAGLIEYGCRGKSKLQSEEQ